VAVFTPVEDADLAHWLEQFSVGSLLRLEGIAGGIENSNFFADTDQGRFVLTLFERLPEEELPFYLELMRYVGERGVPCPVPAAARDGALFKTLNGKPAALVSRLKGSYQPHPGPAQCALAASAMAHLHLAAEHFALRQNNPRDIDWWQATMPQVLSHLDDDRAELLRAEVTEVGHHYQALRRELPFGPIHADLFRDNVLFDGEQLGGLIDFYFAGCDAWLFDVAVAVNDWCIVPDSGELRSDLEHVFLASYASVRPFTRAERIAWPWALRAAALRFWLSRLADVVLPRAATLLKPHDPRHFERIVMRRRAEALEPVVTLPL
jgi:homoserine kinase type II